MDNTMNSSVPQNSSEGPNLDGYAYAICNIGLTLRVLSAISLIVGIHLFCFQVNSDGDRIRIHIHLFLSNLLVDLVGVVQIINALISDSPNHGSTGTITKFDCNFLIIMKIITTYALMSNTFWMTCEAVFILLQVFVVWFKKKTVVIIIMVLGWGAPVPFLVGYFGTIFYYTESNKHSKGCFSRPSAVLEFILIQVPEFAALFFNMVVLIWMVIFLWRGLKNLAPSHWRAVKALFIMTPLLGVHHIVLMSARKDVIFLIAACQGIAVAIVICFTNYRTREDVKRMIRRELSTIKLQIQRGSSSTTGTHL